MEAKKGLAEAPQKKKERRVEAGESAKKRSRYAGIGSNHHKRWALLLLLLRNIIILYQTHSMPGVGDTSLTLKLNPKLNHCVKRTAPPAMGHTNSWAGMTLSSRYFVFSVLRAVRQLFVSVLRALQQVLGELQQVLVLCYYLNGLSSS